MWNGFQKDWRRGLAVLARSARVKAFTQTRAAAFLVRRYVGGDTPQAAVECAARLLRDKSQRASLYALGPLAATPELVQDHVARTQEAVAALHDAGLELHVSMEPTQLGLNVSPALMRENAERIAAAIHTAAGPSDGVHCLMLRMEEHTTTDATIALHDELRARGLPVGLTLQAQLHRTPEDLQRQIDAGGKVRLVTGSYVEDAEFALQDEADIQHAFRDLIYRMFSPEARARGFYPIVATHDTTLHDLAIGLARKHGWQTGQYEFELMLGVRPRVAASLVQRGERVRIYVPFGHDWWPFVLRRLGENPVKLRWLARALLD